MSYHLLSPKALPDRGWAFLPRGGIAIEHYSGKIEASGYLYQERKIADPLLGIVEPRQIVRATTITLSGFVDPEIMDRARYGSRHVTGRVADGDAAIQIWRWTPKIDPLGGYGLWVGMVVDLYVHGERVGDTALISPVVPLRGTDWDGPKPSL